MGNTQLPLEVVDDNGTPNNTSDDLRFISGSQSNNGISYTSGDTNSDGFIDPGETWILTADAQVAQKGLVTNIADLKLIGSTFKSDTASYQGATVINATFEKLVNGDANTDSSNPLAVNVGDEIIYTYRITNTGTEVLGNTQIPLEVVDDNGTPDDTNDDLRFISGSQVNNGISYDSGDTDSDGFIDPGETWILKANPQVAKEGLVTNISNLRLVGTPFKSDTASYTASPASVTSATFDKKVNGQSADTAADAVQVTVGDNITYSYVFTNTGTTDISAIAFTDDIPGTNQSVTVFYSSGPGGDRLENATLVGDDGDRLFEVGETWTFTSTVVAPALAGTIENTVTAQLVGLPNITNSAFYTASPAALNPSLDWKPGSNPSTINLRSNGKTPVAILGSQSFDVTGINVASLRANDELLDGGAQVVQRGGRYMASFEDVNQDGFKDLVVHFNTPDLRGVLSKDGPNGTIRDTFFGDDTLYIFGTNNGVAFQGTQQAGDPLKFL